MIPVDCQERPALRDALHAGPSAQTTPTLASPSFLTSAAVIKQEANLLRFPFFALGRKGLRNRKGLLIRGQSKLDGQSCDFEYRITCNSDDLYPGQLSRKVHMGLLQIMQRSQSFPFANPIQFTWRELMETIGVLPGGRTVQQIKQAIRSTEGTRIRSKFALKNAHGKHLKGRERGYGLYGEYVFFDEVMPDDQTIADKNFVWLADWYLANINSLYCSPLDHGLWQALDDASPIASRMYEFFTFNFAGDWQSLTIDYDKLRRFLPVAPEKHLSQIQKQLGKALDCVIAAGVLAAATWQRGKRGQHQLIVRRGRLLTKQGSPPTSIPATDDLEATEVHDLYRQARPEDELVCQFYALWDGNDHYQPTSTDRTRAKAIIAAYGQQQVESLLPAVVELVRLRFPKAKTFGATTRYWPDAAAEVDYDATADASQLFFKTVQNKMHWGAHGHTAAEIIHRRADSSKPHMGLTTWAGNKPRKTDVGIAKNYLAADEIDALNRIVTAYLEFAELQALNRRAMHMTDWIVKLDDFLRLSDRDILTHAGKISHDAALEKAEGEFAKYRKAQAALPQPVDEHFERSLEELKQIEHKKPALPKKPTKKKTKGKMPGKKKPKHKKRGDD